MSGLKFAHLHLHSEYSLLDGAIRFKQLFKKLKENNMDSVALTDHGTMFGAAEFYDLAKQEGIHPVIGCECYMAKRSLKDKTPQDKSSAHLVLLAENNLGYQNLCKLASIAKLEGFYYKPRIDDEVLKKYSKGLIALSACLKGEIPQLILKKDFEGAKKKALFYNEMFGQNNFFLEVQKNGIQEQEIVNLGIEKLSKELSIPMVATNDCHYLNKEDSRAHEILLCVQTGKTIDDPTRFKFGTNSLYVKTPEEMQSDLGKYEGAVSNTWEIAQRCQVEFDFNTYHFPAIELQPGESEDEMFEREALEGFKKRLEEVKKRNPKINEEEYQKRLQYEIDTIQNMGFSAYFIIVADFIRFSKNSNIPVGPGRGSAAGSMVAYSMGITDLDPIEHNLIFERFLNPERISMPDIDVDFCINGREKVFNYVVEKYGKDKVSHIITYGTMKSRGVLRDVGRALGIPLKEVDYIAKLIPDKIGISLDESIEQEPEIMRTVEGRDDLMELIKVSKVLEGLTRHASTHAAGVVIGDKPLSDYLPLYSGKQDETITQFDMEYVEKIGLVKFDFLGLRNLTVIAEALRLIEKQGLLPPDLKNLDFEDQATFELLKKGDTTGVFQLESSGMKDLLKRLKPESFNDIIALVALYRPGPLESGMVNDFVKRKHGEEKISYPIAQLEPILKETYGVILYQEQVMKIASVLANYSMADADGLRKAMGKKIKSMMDEHRAKFLEGAKENKIAKDKAEYIFDLMEKFAGYGFNKSHSAAYALISYQTAYLKAHFPVAFMAALLNSEINSIDGVVKFIDECKLQKIEILKPNINKSDTYFKVEDNKIRFGLAAAKNVGESVVDHIVEERQKNDEFKDIFDFCERCDLRKVNKRVVEALIKCGAFDGTGIKRAQLVSVIEEATEYGQRVKKDKASPQMGFFDSDESFSAMFDKPVVPDIEEWDEKELLLQEKEALGFYISGHPLNAYKDVITTYSNADSLSLGELKDGDIVIVGGILSKIKVIYTKKNDKMAFVTIEDFKDFLEIVVFSDLYVQTSDYFYEDSVLMVAGKVQKNEKGLSLIAIKIYPADLAEENLSGCIYITMESVSHTPEDVLKLQEILRRHPGTKKIYIDVFTKSGAQLLMELPDILNVNITKELVEELREFAGKEKVWVKPLDLNVFAEKERKPRFTAREKKY
ncbi:MAG: DNA polymerase III subunit alpha [Desulforegulaceae bacterium]|nr:DNA polymerase III subunit alpha [Desulforegulaceae bacterium]